MPDRLGIVTATVTATMAATHYAAANSSASSQMDYDRSSKLLHPRGMVATG
jgi:hypothetical protein